MLRNNFIIRKTIILPFVACLSMGFIGSNPETEATEFMEKDEYRANRSNFEF